MTVDLIKRVLRVHTHNWACTAMEQVAFTHHHTWQATPVNGGLSDAVLHAALAARLLPSCESSNVLDAVVLSDSTTIITILML